MEYVKRFNAHLADAKSFILAVFEKVEGRVIGIPRGPQPVFAPKSFGEAQQLLDQMSSPSMVSLADEFCRLGGITKHLWSTVIDDLGLEAIADIETRVLKSGKIIFKDLSPDSTFKGPDGQAQEVPTILVTLFAKDATPVTEVVAENQTVLVVIAPISALSQEPVDIAIPLVDLQFTEILRLADFLSIV